MMTRGWTNGRYTDPRINIQDMIISERAQSKQIDQSKSPCFFIVQKMDWKQMWSVQSPEFNKIEETISRQNCIISWTLDTDVIQGQEAPMNIVQDGVTAM